MKKILSLVTASSFLVSCAINVSACSITDNSQINKTAPIWSNKLIANSEKNNYNYRVGYQANSTAYYLSQKNSWDTSTNSSINGDFYIYLKNASTVVQATNYIKMEDSATPWNVTLYDKSGKKITHLNETINWVKKDNNTYVNNSYITEDTTVGGYATLNKEKFKDIDGNSKTKDWPPKVKTDFEKWGSTNNTSSSVWWNLNKWEKLLTTKVSNSVIGDNNKNYSQLDLYNAWNQTGAPGMNVPLSLMKSGDFILTNTNINHLFLLKINLKEDWIFNDGNIKSINSPHWGVTFKIQFDNKTVYKSPQIVNLNNCQWHNNVINYLQNLDSSSPIPWKSINNIKFQSYYADCEIK